MAEFMLFGTNFTIPDSYIRDYIMNIRSGEASEAAEKEFNAWYKKCSNIDNVIKGYYNIASTLMYKYALSPLFKQLAILNIYDMSEGMYADYVADYEG